MNRSKAVAIIKELAPELYVSGDQNDPYVNVARTKDSIPVHSIVVPLEDLDPTQQREVLEAGVNNARRMLPRE